MSRVLSERSCCSATFGTCVVTAAMETHEHIPREKLLSVYGSNMWRHTHQVFRPLCMLLVALQVVCCKQDKQIRQDHILIYETVGMREIFTFRQKT